MISDERLREAARKAEESLLASLPEPEECEAAFSPEFERKMEKLIHRAKHPIRHRVMKAVACFLLVILVGGGSVLTFSMEARAAFVGWVQEVYETYFSHRYTGIDRVAPSNAIYCPQWLPDGYKTTTIFDSALPVTIIYSHESGDSITFSCLMSTESINLQIDREHTDAIDTFVGNKSATLYQDDRKGEANVLVWTNDQEGVLFIITSTLDHDTMLKIAESVDILELEK